MQVVNDMSFHVCASHRRFQPITRDFGSFQKMPNFALSRRQRGFESRWGYKIKPALTRSNTSHPCVRRQPQHELRERAGSETATATLDAAALLAAWVPPCRLASGVFAAAPEAGTRRLQQLRSGPPVAGPRNGTCSTRTRRVGSRPVATTSRGPRTPTAAVCP
jgi:hypothetical protein